MIIDGKKIGKEILSSLKKELSKFKKIILAIVVVGNNPASWSFLKQKEKIAKYLGIELKVYKFPSTISNKELILEIEKITEDEKVKGIIIQLPLPKKLNLSEVLKVIPPQKDVDALGEKPINLAPSVEVVKFIFKKYSIKYNDKSIVINGFGRLIGKPIYNWLKETVSLSNISIIEKNTLNKEKLIKKADIIISGVGKANLIPANLIKRNAVVIDFGYDFQKGKIYGDIEKESADKTRLFTPTPGGTGPILVAMIFKNLVNLLNSN